jgi:Mrp family chromosome partitioning ATPase
MSEKSERLITEDEILNHRITDPTLSVTELTDMNQSDDTQRLQPWPTNRIAGENQHQSDGTVQDLSMLNGTEKKQADSEKELSDGTEKSPPESEKANSKKIRGKKEQFKKFNKRDKANARMLQERCRQLYLSLFSRENAPVRSLGFTSSIDGEGKSFLAQIMSQLLAHDSNIAVTLVDCDWEHPSQHEKFSIPVTPGLAEWLRGTCDEDDIRYPVADNLTIIPAGNGAQEAVKLLKKVQQDGLPKAFKHSNELYIVDLPPIITSGYGSLAASLVDSIVIVVRTQVIPDYLISETCSQLKNLPVQGIILNQNESRIPRWIRQIL